MQEGDFRLLFESSPEVLLVLLPDSPRFTMVAATAVRFEVTHTSAETLGKGLFEVFPDNPEDLEATGTSNLRASLERVLATRQPDTMAVQKYDIRGPDGTFQKKYWSPKNIPVLSETGEVRFILHRVEDVTELVQASELGEELRDRTKQMEVEVVMRCQELAQANQRLRDANTKLGEVDVAKTAFFSNVSHEFRTPLTLILGPLENALRNPEEQLDKAELSAMHRNALRLLRLVSSLLDFSRLEAGRMQATFHALDLAELTAGLVGAFQSLMTEAGLRFVVDCPRLPEPMFVDPAHWEKIVLNLVSNAFKFTLHGEIAVRLRWCGDHAELSVEDSGTGIPEQELPRVFERFHRVEGAQGRSHEGTGIGLSLVSELARQHGGAVTATSAVGRGSTFVVSIPAGSGHLPPDSVVKHSEGVTTVSTLRSHLLEARQWLRSAAVEDTPAAELESKAQAVTPGSSAGRVLIADDNSDMRDYIVRLLSPEWEVTAVGDGRAALAAARRARPDIVVSDVMMPELDGIGLLSALREDPGTRTIPVVLLSARAGEEARLEGLETGADDYLVKPFSARELLARVRTQVELGRMRSTAAETARELAETRARLLDELERKNHELKASFDSLAQTQAQLVQAAKMASLGQLVAGIAHELNNPLAFLLSHLGTVERVLAEMEPLLQREQQDGKQLTSWRRAGERAKEMKLGLTRIQELVQKLRIFSRLDEGELKRVSLRESVDAALMILGHRLQDRIVVTTVFGALDEIECYASLLNQALVNLLTNAIEAIEARGSIRISTEVDTSSLVLRIVDDGTGISEAVRERVFEPFFTTKPIGHGTGLGLSITYSIIQKHGGTLDLLPRQGGGTEAVVKLPLRS